MDLPRAHATLTVALDGPDDALPPRLRTFFLRDLEREPEPHVTTPLGTTTDAGTRPASFSAVDAHWVEASPDPPRAGTKGTRARPYHLREVLVGRGPVGGLLAQEFLDAYADAERFLALQAEADRRRSAVDATRWTDADRRDIEAAQRALEDAFYAARFPYRLVVTAIARRFRDALRDDLKALDAPRARFVDATGDA